MTLPQDSPFYSNGKDLPKYTMAVAVMMTGVAAYKIRKFEDFGLCKPVRTASKQRLYSDSDIDLIRRITSLEQGGVNLAGVKVILDMQQSIRLNGVNP